MVILSNVTKKTAISLPDDLFREIERARKRSKMDRSTWIQEAANDYLAKRTKAAEEEAYFAGYERMPLTADELALDRWKAKHWAQLFIEETGPKPKRKAR